MAPFNTRDSRSLSVFLTAIFHMNLGYPVFIEQRMIEAVATSGLLEL